MESGFENIGEVPYPAHARVAQLHASSGQKNGFGALRTCKTDAPDASDDPMLIYIRVNVCVGGGSGGGGNPMHRVHRIWMMAIGWVADSR